MFQKQNEAEITDLGRQYGLVTPFTSLIVLESLDQYVEHRILPPTNLPGMRAKYARVMEDRLSKEKKEKKDKLEDLLALWNKRVEWWNTGFKYAEGFKYRNREKDQSRRAVHVTDINGPAVSSVNPAASQPPTEGAAIPERAGPALLDLVPATTLAQEGAAHESAPGIAIKEWDPSTPYVQALKKSRPQDAFATYLLQRKKYAASPAFYLDCAEFFRKQKQDAVGIQVLSNLAELELENAGLLRVLAYRLQQIGQLDLACGLFDQVLRLRPEEPQSFRDLALALAQRCQAAGNPADGRRALDLFAHVVNNQWDRFDEIEVIALMELNAYWAEFSRRFPNDKAPFPVDERLKTSSIWTCASS